MEQEVTLNAHNLAKDESKASPVCSAEAKQGQGLNAHNKQEFPPAHTARFDTSLIKRVFCVVLLLLYMGTLCAQDRMTPAKFEQGREENLYCIFDIAEADGFAFLADPAFCPDYCLAYDRVSKSLILKQLKPRVRYCRRLRFSQRLIRADVWKLGISDSLADSLKRMFAAVVLTSSWLCEQRDGVNYYFLISPGFSSKTASWPDENSNCRQAVDVVGRLCEAVRKNDREGALVGSISSVTNLFRNYYPADFQERIH